MNLVSMVLILGGTVLLSFGGMLLTRRLVRVEIQEKHKEVAGFVYAVVGVLYGVTLGFVVVSIWSDFEAAKVIGGREAGELADIWWLSAGLEPPAKQRIQRVVLDYTRVVVKEEWPAMERLEESRKAWALTDSLWGAVHSFEPRTVREQVIFRGLLDHVARLGEHRRLRLLASQEGLPGMTWLVLIAGGLITMVFTYFFTLEHMWVQGLMTTLLAVLIGLQLMFIAALDYPFSGFTKLPPRAFEAVLHTFESE